MKTILKTNIRTRIAVVAVLLVVVFGGLYSIGHLSYSSIPFIRSKVDLFRLNSQVKSLNKKIAKKELVWTAGITDLSVMSYKQFGKYLGNVDFSVPDNIRYYNNNFFEMVENFQIQPIFPKEYSWDNINGINYMTPVRNQRGCGSCWAHSVIGIVESQTKIKDGNDHNLSEQELISCSGAGDCVGGEFRRCFVLYSGKRIIIRKMF